MPEVDGGFLLPRPVMNPSPGGGRVVFDPSRGSSLTLLVASAPERGGGVGGWQPSERRLRRPAKWFQGTPDDTYSWELILDLDEVGGPPIERRLQVLRDMGQPGDHDEPPTITVTGDLWEADQGIDWVIEDVTFGERLWTPTGALRRQNLTVTLSRYSPVSEIEAVRIIKTRNGTKKRVRTVQSKGNDTIRAIALRELGDGSRWKDIVRWNKRLAKANPDARLRTGTHVTLR